MRDLESREPAGDDPAAVAPAIMDQALVIPVTVPDLVRAADAIDRLPEAERDSFERRSMAIMRSFWAARPEDRTSEQRFRSAMVILGAIHLRIECLAVLLGSPRLRAWTLPIGGDGKAKYIRNLVLEVAATAPLRLTDGPDGIYHFDEAEFVRRLMEATPAGGKA
ncbi:MAG: hypothetical protein U1E14_21210 [Geminicoccaceae bacterium]